jgi:hypothetical protein
MLSKTYEALRAAAAPEDKARSGPVAPPQHPPSH